MTHVLAFVKWLSFRLYIFFALSLALPNFAFEDSFSILRFQSELRHFLTFTCDIFILALYTVYDNIQLYSHYYLRCKKNIFQDTLRKNCFIDTPYKTKMSGWILLAIQVKLWLKIFSHILISACMISKWRMIVIVTLLFCCSLFIIH